jgi:uncharacterized RDD family membrane protein YckC
MSQVPDWNKPSPAQATQQPQFDQQVQYDQQAQFGQSPQFGQVDPQAMMAPGGYGMPGMSPQVPLGMYQDQVSGLVLPDGTTLAPVGRRIGAYFLAGLLSIVTLGLGYLIWGAITWSNGQSPTQQILGLQTWKPEERVNATWGTMFLRGLAWTIIGVIPFAQLVSFFFFLSGKEHRALHDSMSSTVVLHDPNKVLRPVDAVQIPAQRDAI